MRTLAVVIAALAFAPAASAWTTLTGGVGDTVVPSIIITQAGTQLSLVGDRPAARSRCPGTTPPERRSCRAILSPGRTQLLQQPNGAIQLYFPNAQGVGRMTSTDDGQTWTGPIQTQSHTTGPVQGAAVAPDGTPYFSQDGTGFVNVFRGLNGESVKNVFPRCCGYAESLAVDTTGLAASRVLFERRPRRHVPLREARRRPQRRPTRRR